MSVVRVNQIQDTSTNVAANISGGVVTFTNTPINAGGGKVLQVINAKSLTDSGAVTGTTAILTASITPSSTSSRIFVTAMASCQLTSGSNGIIASDMFRGSTSGTLISRYYEGVGGTTNNAIAYHTPSHSVIDSPSTTNATTYTFSIAKGSGGTQSVRTIGSAAHPILMCLMEIGG